MVVDHADSPDPGPFGCCHRDFVGDLSDSLYLRIVLASTHPPYPPTGTLTEPAKLAIFGGSFDPPHCGHLHVIKSAVDQLALNSVLLIPACRPPHKPDRLLAPAEHRLRMCELLAELHPAVRVDACELERSGTSYTIQTVTELRQRSHWQNAQLYFLIGSDSLRDLPTWYRIHELLQMVNFVTIPRDLKNCALIFQDLESQVSAPDLANLRRHVLNIPPLPISSTEIRQRCRRGESITGMVPATIHAYIEQHQLYRQQGADQPAEQHD